MLIYPNISPFIIDFSFIKIKWYSISYIIGFFYCSFFCKKQMKLSQSCIDSAFIYSVSGCLLGARLLYVCIYNPIYYWRHPIEIFFLWNGGMSFHGALVGVLISIYLFTKKNNISFLNFTDCVATSVPLALMFGRIANFINGELYGRKSNCSICMIFPADPFKMPRHPSQLYEAFFEGFILFLIINILFFYSKMRRIYGLIGGFFLIYYSIIRISIEFFREPDIQVGFLFNYFTLGQIFSLLMLLSGIFVILYSIKISKHIY